MRGLIRCSFSVLLLVVPASAAERPWQTSVEKAFADAKSSDRAILVDLYAEWCGWCKRLEEDVFSTPIFQEFASDFVLLRVDTEDRAEGTRLQEEYGAYSLPTTLVLDQDGVLIASIPGYSPAPQYISTIETKIAAFDELVNGYEKYGGSSDLRILGILADEFHKRKDGVRSAALCRRMLASGELGFERAIRIRYQLSDALRLARLYDEAWTEIESARSDLARSGRRQMLERFELLAAQVSIDRGNCSQAESALKQFLTSHPNSDLRPVARRSLAALKAEGYRCS